MFHRLCLDTGGKKVNSMFILNAERSELTVLRKETVASGSGEAYRVRFQFSRHWEGLKAIAVFKAGDTSVTVMLDKSGMCRIPWKVLTTPGVQLRAGVYGTKAGSVVLPTLWAGLGTIQEGAGDGGGTVPDAQNPAAADHSALTHRDAADQHPMGAVTGLEEALARRLTADDAMTAADIMKIMEG